MDENRIIPLNIFLNTMKESCENGKRFCFILGAGASKTSGIPTGEEMAKRWYEELTHRYSTEDLRALQKRLNVRSIKPSSKNYFGLYAMRFWPVYSNGSAFLENTLERAQPSLGYYPLATLLASTEYNNNLVITTNFDSLVEDALFIYTEKRPLVISHELLADYINFNTKRPIVAKLHRGLFFDPLNREEQVNGLSGKWKEILHQAFKIYTPVVIGYAGGDHSLMDFLSKEAKVDGLYWCYRHEEPSAEILELVEKNNGYFLSIEGFDEMMYLLGQKFEYENPCGRIKSVAERRVEDYNKQVQEFEEKLSATTAPSETQSQILASLSQKQADELRELNALIEKNPEDAQAYKRRGLLYRSAKKYKDALDDFARSTELKADADTYFQQGYTYTLFMDRKKAVEAYTRSLAISENAVAYNNRGACYNVLGAYEKALIDFNRSIELGNGSAVVYSNRGRAYLRLKQYQSAIEDGTKAIELDAKYLNGYSLRGDGYYALGQYDLSVADYTMLIGLYPEDSSYYNNRGIAYQELGYYKKALADYNKAIKLDPEEPIYFTNRAEIYNLTHRYKEAITNCNKAIKLNPNYADAYKARAEAYEGQGQTAKAERDREKYKELKQET